MKINNEKLLKRLDEKWKGIECPYCKLSKWTVDPVITTTIQVGEKKEMRVGGRFQPFIPVTCRNCGNTVLVNGLVLGCLEDISDSEIDSNEEENGEQK